MVDVPAGRRRHGCHGARVWQRPSTRRSSWPHARRIIMKAEVVALEGKDPRDNPRFVITNLTQTPRWIYETVYCQRGEIENRIKELHHGLEIDRTSCTKFWANQCRVLLTRRKCCSGAPPAGGAHRLCPGTGLDALRERLLKLGAQVVASVRRLVLHLPRPSPTRTPGPPLRGASAPQPNFTRRAPGRRVTPFGIGVGRRAGQPRPPSL